MQFDAGRSRAGAGPGGRSSSAKTPPRVYRVTELPITSARVWIPSGAAEVLPRIRCPAFARKTALCKVAEDIVERRLRLRTAE